MINKFITIEGVDGAGKSTAVSSIKNFLESQGEKVVLTREPGGTDLGERLRDLLLHHKMDLLAETLLMFTARVQNIKEVIRPSLNDGSWVICDRFTDSTIAYQGYAKGLELSKIKALQTLVQEDLTPGITFVLDVTLSKSKENLAKTNKIPDKFESESDSFFDRVINGFKMIARKDPNRCKLINAVNTKEETAEQVIFEMKNYYEKMYPTKSTKMKM